MDASRTSLFWQLLLRLTVGSYWIYFSSQRWYYPLGVKNTFITAAQGNYVPGYGQFLRAFILPNSDILLVGVTILETVIGFMILLGVFTKTAAALGAFNNLNLTLTFSFCKCSWSEADFPLVFWFYFAPLLLNIQVIFDRSSKVYSLSRIVRKLLYKTKRE